MMNDDEMFETVDSDEISVKGRLKPCPFCGCEIVRMEAAWTADTELMLRVLCVNCNMESVMERSYRECVPKDVALKDAVKLMTYNWNHRAVPSDIDAMMDIHRRLSKYVSSHVRMDCWEHEEIAAISRDLLEQITLMYRTNAI